MCYFTIAHQSQLLLGPLQKRHFTADLLTYHHRKVTAALLIPALHGKEVLLYCACWFTVTLTEYTLWN